MTTCTRCVSPLVSRVILGANAQLLGKLSLRLLQSRRMASNGTSISKWQLEEKNGDLFQAPAVASLAHCVSEDFHMGKGIAVAFREKFGRVDELKKQEKRIGDVAVLEVKGKYVYYLVTKKKYSGKPTYSDLQTSLEAMRDHCLKAGVTHVAMPRIGCGLDRLQYDRVKTILCEVFSHTPVAITIYSL